MNFGLLFFQFLPLFIYIAVDYLKGYKAGIYAAIGASVFMLAWDYHTTHAVDSFSLGEAFLITVLGIVSLKMNNDRYFKFQPTVVGIIFAGIFLTFEIKKEPVMVKMIPQMEKIFAGQDNQNPTVTAFLEELHSPMMEKVLARASRMMIVLFLAHAAVMAYAALYLSNGAWFGWRLAIYPAMMVGFVIVRTMA